MIEEKRATIFTQSLSLFMAKVAAAGALLVLIDPKFTLTAFDQTVTIGGTGFSADLKGLVIGAILIGGWNSIKEYWLGSSAGSEKKSDAIQKMVEAAPAVTAAAVAAAAIQPTKEVKP